MLLIRYLLTNKIAIRLASRNYICFDNYYLNYLFFGSALFWVELFLKYSTKVAKIAFVCISCG